MSTYSHVNAYIENPTRQVDEVRPIMDSEEFENSEAVSIDPDDEFDNFTIDLSKLPPGTKYIKFSRG